MFNSNSKHIFVFLAFDKIMNWIIVIVKTIEIIIKKINHKSNILKQNNDHYIFHPWRLSSTFLITFKSTRVNKLLIKQMNLYVQQNISIFAFYQVCIVVMLDYILETGTNICCFIIYTNMFSRFRNSYTPTKRDKIVFSFFCRR